MKFGTWLYALVGIANGMALIPRDVQQESALQQAEPEEKGWDNKKSWRPHTGRPQYFSLKVDERCKKKGHHSKKWCRFEGYAIRLEDGIVIATPYNKWWDEKLPVFFVDDDTHAYTVGKKPRELYIHTVTGALQYRPVGGWKPANAVTGSFYKFGNNPLGWVDPSLAYFSWPLPKGRGKHFASTWWLCPLNTGQYQVFIDWKHGGVEKDGCKRKNLAAVNANPWGH
ncbi:hypothetical protein CC86DRAFT_116406 [Ophiobolus disseminans]|uniref:Uncharacterized protein n=1 Tax=Ophiobolus disseminans TaxID=1469910 RepID=A0A6A6ZK81_9PLEO|nr:hypothetical protein CC86DRAFT_116406 [Ophiobolus disseminans]